MKRKTKLKMGLITDIGAMQDLSKKYHELLSAVGNKYEGETRHETALRYLKSAEGAGVGDRIALSTALRDCLSVFRSDPLTVNVTKERVEAWEKALAEHALYDFPQCVSVEGPKL